MKTWLPHLRQDIAFFLLLTTISLCKGLLVNQFRDKSLPLIYEVDPGICARG